MPDAGFKQEKILVTSALPYANGPIHLGHIAGAYLPADIFCRFKRMQGHDVVFICGSDEHGVPIAIKADNEKITPQEIVDRYHGMNKESFEILGISFDNYSRTTSKVHYKTSQDFFKKLYDDGYFTEKEDTQLYSEVDKMFLPDRFVEGTCPNCNSEGARGDQCEKCGSWLEQADLVNPISKISGDTPVPKVTKHWYIALGRMQEEVKNWIDSKDDWKENVVNYCRGWFDDGLEDRAVTRDLDWGIPVPIDGAEGKVMYVWFDAPIGYISATKEWAEAQGDKELWKKYWCELDTKIYNFIGKDNIVFHAIFFPVMLMAHGDFTLPENVVANEFLNLEGRKISTSQNFAVWVDEYLKDFPVDPMRYCLASISPETRDADFSWKDFQARNNNELADIIGNFINRTMVFLGKNFDNIMPEVGELSEASLTALKDADSELDLVAENLEKFKVKAAIKECVNIGRIANKFFNDSEPWKSVKADEVAAAETLNICVRLIFKLGLGMAPFMPFTTEKINKMLGTAGLFKKSSWDELKKHTIPSGQNFEKPEILFKKIEDDVIQKELDKLESVVTDKPEEKVEVKEVKVEKKEEPQSSHIKFEDFKKLDLRVAEVKSVARVPNTDKLMRLEVFDGDDIRFIISGIADKYSEEELVGKSIILFANLKPAKIRGEISNGMLLAAGDGEELALLMTDKLMKPGSIIS